MPLSRRTLLTGGVTAAIATVPVAEAATLMEASCNEERLSLDGRWLFRLDPDGKGEANGWAEAECPMDGWREVEVPHTWQVEPENTEYRGVGWYRRSFEAPAEWSSRAVRVEFEAVFHSAVVFVNGTEAGRHVGKGYTAFTLDIVGALRPGARNTVAVRVDNAFSESMLPRGRSSDWAHDGGIYRSVRLIVTPRVFIESIAVDAEPDLAANTASVAVTVVVRNTSSHSFEGVAGFTIADEQTGNVVLTQPPGGAVRIAAGETKSMALTAATLRNPELWHFDHPNLYRVTAVLGSGHALDSTFGIRKIEIRNSAFYLNGERVRLMGAERMAGSNPEYGMAEPAEWIAHDHADMRRLNCIYTRTHWPQDRAVLDWCDRHGMLIQTEVPTWGGATFRERGSEPAAEIMNNGIEQLREMIARDRNHPCIFSWGVCNEIGGQNPTAYTFAKRMYEESKRLDSKRLVSYASNSLFENPGKDVSGLMDYVMCNEYVESWQPGTVKDLGRILDEIHRAFPEKPVVISEYGYCACTPERPEGDGKRISVLLGHDLVFRDRDYIAGLIFFCYNDYRTHIGDRGVGALKQRVHGVVDVYGTRKPSYETLRTESSPLKSVTIDGTLGELRVQLQTRSSVPSYTLRGYKLRTLVFGYGNIPVERYETSLPELRPHEKTLAVVKFSEMRPVQVQCDVMRPDGLSTLTAIWRL
jgi:beta-glucuronidase